MTTITPELLAELDAYADVPDIYQGHRYVELDPATLRALVAHVREVEREAIQAFALRKQIVGMAEAVRWHENYLVQADYDALAAKLEEAKEALTDALAHLTAANSLLSRSSKKAAPSDKMFGQMLADYKASEERCRAALSRLTASPASKGDEG